MYLNYIYIYVLMSPVYVSFNDVDSISIPTGSGTVTTLTPPPSASVSKVHGDITKYKFALFCTNQLQKWPSDDTVIITDYTNYF